MSTNPYKDSFNETAEFKGSLKWSLIAHAAIVLIFGVKAAFFQSEPIDYSAAVRVDIVALPDKLDPNNISLETPKEKSAETVIKSAEKPKPKVVEKSTEPDAINLNKAKSKQKEALEKIKKMSAIDKIKNDMERERADREALKKVVQVKGNIISPGTALTGLNRVQHEAYISDLDRHVKERWSLPEWLAKRDFKAQVRLRLDENGQIISREIVRSSGNQSYDDMVLTTIDQSAPFPRPPEKFVAIVSVQGILIGFPE
jgi:colicin import membrane protein